MLSYFTFLATIATLQFTLSVVDKLYTSYNIVIRVMHVVIFNDLDVVFATESILKLNYKVLDCNHVYNLSFLPLCIYNSHNFKSAR